MRGLFALSGVWAAIMSAGVWCVRCHADETLWTRHVLDQGWPCITVIAADFAGDKRMDVIAGGPAKAVLYVAPSWKPVTLDESAGQDLIHSEALDMDRDGDTDYVAARYTPGLVLWRERPAHPESQPWPLHVLDEQVDGIHGLLAADLDADGKRDLIANSALPRGPFRNSVAWYKAADNWSRNVLANGDAPGLSHYMGAADINGDGRPDVTTAAKGGPTAEPGTGDWFAWWEAPADPTKVWSKHAIAEGQAGATNIHPADVNADGVTDVIVSRGHDRGVFWFEGPSWVLRDIDPNIHGPHCLVALDLDADGDTDAATCGKDDRIAAWYENDGKGKFAIHIVARDQAAYDLRAVDLDADRDFDLLVAGQDSQNVVWYANPMFTPANQ